MIHERVTATLLQKILEFTDMSGNTLSTGSTVKIVDSEGSYKIIGFDTSKIPVKAVLTRIDVDSADNTPIFIELNKLGV